MMENELISFELSKLVKEKNINIETYFYYNNKGELQDCFNSGHGSFVNNVKLSVYAAYSLNTLQRILRDNYNIEVRVHAEHYLTGTNWNVQALKFNLSKEYSYLNFIEDGTYMYGDDGQYDTYEQALEKGLELGLTLIK